MISEDQFLELKNHLYGGNFISKKNTREERFEFGNLWFGNYYELSYKNKFGSENKKYHWGCIAGYGEKKRVARKVLPITSKARSSKSAYCLPKGLIESGRNCASYVLLNPFFELLVRTETLENKFKYEGLLPEIYRKELKECLQEKDIITNEQR